MINNIKTELKTIILLFVYGIFLMYMFDIIKIISNKFKKKIFKIVIEVIMWICNIYVSYKYIYVIQNGAIPVYFILFLFIGAIMYFLVRKHTIVTTNLIVNIIFKIINYFKKEIKESIWPQYLKVYFKEIFMFVKKRTKYKKIKDIETGKKKIKKI